MEEMGSIRLATITLGAITLESTHSMRVSLSELRYGHSGLNAHRQSLLVRIPNIGDWGAFRRDSVEFIDLAYLSAQTGHEFALLRGKREDVVYHGTARNCNFEGLLEESLKSHRLELYSLAYKT